jgi:FKBP-type peptidyl-prolyl cis-trans isomerase FkpA
MKNLLFFYSLVFILASCSSQDSNKKLSSGMVYGFVTDVDGKTIQSGEVAAFHGVIRLIKTKSSKDSILADTKEMDDKPQYYVIPEPEEMEGVDDALIELLLLMSKGDEAYFWQKIDTIQDVAAQFPGYDAIRYDISLLDVLDLNTFEEMMEAENAAKRAKAAEVMALEEGIAAITQQALKDYNAGKLKSDLIELPNGTEVLILEQGSGDLFIPGEEAVVHYYGVLKSNGEMFDNSFRRGEPFSVQVGLGYVIKGWDEALVNLKRGSSAVIFIPSDQGYGKAGSPPKIPQDSDLVFYIEIDK